MTLLEEQLDSLIDQYGACKILKAMAQVCFEKSAHVAVNWQDMKLARLWEREGKRLDRFSQHMRVHLEAPTKDIRAQEIDDKYD